MQATAESMHAVAVATMPRPARVELDGPPPAGFPQSGMKACHTCGAACHGHECQPCYFKRRKQNYPGRVRAVCPGFREEACGKPLSTPQATHCRKHAARMHWADHVKNAVPASKRKCQPGNLLHAFDVRSGIQHVSCTCGLLRGMVMAEAVPA